jgi:hypothetical protein
MTKEQFLAMSLPHGLKVYISSKFGDFVSDLWYKNYSFFQRNGITVDGCISLNGKPICIPLSDLTKRKWFTKLENKACRTLVAASVYNEKTILKVNWNKEPFEIVMWLIKNHFDIAGLIEKGEAIDVNTLDKNPYE